MEKENSGQFKKGFVPWNKGLVGFGNVAGFRVHGKTTNTGRTRFKKGHRPWIAGTGIVWTCKFCSKNFRRHGRKQKAIFCSKACQGKWMQGSNHFNWKGGRGWRPMGRKKYREWRIAVFSRDNFTCQFCGVRGGRIEADHIKWWSEYPKLRYKVSNGRTLCRACHLTTLKKSK